jgi:hypothetical protein
MTGFYKDLLQKDEQRSVKISRTAEEAATKPKVENKIKVEAEEKICGADYSRTQCSWS